MTALALYTVEAPTFGSMTATFATPGIYGQSVVLGLQSPYPNSGIISKYTATAPNDFAGYFAENQQEMTNPYASPSSSPGLPQTGTASWLDACWIYDVQANGLNSPAPLASAAATVTYGPSYDAPAYGLARLDELNFDDTYVDHFMFTPDVPGWHHRVWVNFGVLQWSWGGDVVADRFLNTAPVGWKFNSEIAPGPTQTGVPNTDLVGWPNTLAVEGSSCPAPPAENSQSRTPRKGHGATPTLRAPRSKLKPPWGQKK
ncbi:MAG: hypothetical protein JOZ77_01275 [Candidatus Eremiobacteraeota bacterium]|nr:hypothetical protein [Candidatus Eremiobacteraeota bacterium]